MTSPSPTTLSPAIPALRGRAVEPAPIATQRPWVGWIRPRDLSRGHAVSEFFWESPDGEALYASGEAARLECRGPERFNEARGWLGSLRATARFESPLPDDALLAVARFGFENEPGHDDDEDASVLLVPERLLVRRAGESDRGYEWEPVERGPRPRNHGAPGTPAAPRRPEWSREGWDGAVAHVLARIGSGDLEKVVLARTRSIRTDRAWDPDALFLRLREDYPDCYRFLLRDPRGSVLIGASPERLVSLRRGVVRTDAVAGTSRHDGHAGGAAEVALLADAKQIREHAVVAREIATALAEAGTDVSTLPPPSIFRLRRLMHLRTQIAATARPGVGVLELVERLHPTPAVAGTPRAAALATISSLEPRRRGWYAGPIGWTSATGDGDFAVGLRTARLEGDRALLFAGAGIVAGSDAEREWDECESKMDVIEEVLRHEGA